MGHFCGPAVRGRSESGAFDLIILWLPQLGERQGWGGVGCGLRCGEESEFRPDP